MVRITFLSILFVLSCSVSAQEYGISAGLKRARYFSLPYDNPGAPNTFTGVNGEFVFRKHIDNLVFRVGAGVDFFLPGNDSLMSGGYRNSTIHMFRIDTKTTITNFFFRGGVDFLQERNPLMSFYIGTGLGMRKLKITRTVVDFNPATDVLIDDSDDNTYHENFPTLAIYLGGLYEFRYFSPWIQADFIYTGTPSIAASVGVYVPLTPKED